MTTSRIRLVLGALAPCLSCAMPNQGDADGEGGDGAASASSSGTSDSTASTTHPSDGTTSPELACEPDGAAELVLDLQPLAATDVIIHGPCTVTAVADAPAVLALACTAEDGSPLDVTLGLGELPFASLAEQFAVGDAVQLDYGRHPAYPRDHGFAAVRRADESTPRVVVVSSTQPVIWFEENSDFAAPFVLELLQDTDCAPTPSACNDDALRRAAVRVTLPGQAPVVVFDGNDGALDGYHVRVGEATFDAGDCDGLSETWYAFLIVADGP